MRVNDFGAGWQGLEGPATPADADGASARLWKEQLARRTPPPPGTYSAALARPPGVLDPGVAARAPNQPGRRDEARREAGRAAGREGAAARNEAGQAGAARQDGECGAGLAPVAARQQGGGGGGGSGQDGEQAGGAEAAKAAEAAEAATAASGAASELDQIEQELVNLGSDDGLFELLLPNQETLAVLVSHSHNGVGFMLTPSAPALKKQLDTHRMELEGRLAQRIGRTTRLTVL
ncbi:MAG: hypothetical protein V4754_19040 [Pseudomonadota bacterium]